MLSCLTVFGEGEEVFVHVAGCLDLMVFRVCAVCLDILWTGVPCCLMGRPSSPTGDQQCMETHYVRCSHSTPGAPLVTHLQKPYSSTSWCSLILHSRKMLTDERGRCLQEAGHQAPVISLRVKEEQGYVREAEYPEMAVEGLYWFNSAWNKQRLFRNKTEQQ